MKKGPVEQAAAEDASLDEASNSLPVLSFVLEDLLFLMWALVSFDIQARLLLF